MQIGQASDWQADMPVDAATYAAWYRAVQEIAPPNESLTWLHLAWEPGDPWEPVERWCIWQMRPRRLIALDTWLQLEGPHPRSQGHYCAVGHCECAIKYNAWKGGAAATIDRMQWELYHADGPTKGCYGTRWWIVQGHGGGNLRRFTTIQSKIARIQGGEGDPPVPGALCYAPVDQRVLDAIAQRDRMRTYGLMTDFALRNSDQLDAEEKEGARLAKRELQAWIGTQIREVVSEGGRALMRQLAGVSSLPAGFKDTTDYDAEFAALLEDE